MNYLLHRGKLKYFNISNKLTWLDRFSWEINGKVVGGTVADWYHQRPKAFIAIVTTHKIPVATAVYQKFKTII